MRYRGLGLVCLLWVVGLGSAAGQGSIAERYLFSAANAERAQRGLQPLRWDMTLYRAAVGHAREMAARENISHQYAGEPELAERGKRVGARFSRIAENVAEAPSAVRIHAAWMNSPGHRENLLDPQVDAVAISVLQRNGQLYAVQDFVRTVQNLSYNQQEETVARLVESSGNLQAVPGLEDARQTCEMNTGYAGRKPWFVMRYTASDLSSLPSTLQQKLASGKYHQAAVGACPVKEKQPFTMYNIAVLLYP